MLSSNIWAETNILNMERNIIISLILTSIALDNCRSNDVAFLLDADGIWKFYELESFNVDLLASR